MSDPSEPIVKTADVAVAYPLPKEGQPRHMRLTISRGEVRGLTTTVTYPEGATMDEYHAARDAGMADLAAQLLARRS
jgi:hypothetical protein